MDTFPGFFRIPYLKLKGPIGVDIIKDLSQCVPQLGHPTLAKYKEWRLSPDTNAWFLSGVGGLIQQERVSNENPAAWLHGMIADFDTPLELIPGQDEHQSLLTQIAKWKKRHLRNPEILPQYVALTYSKGLRCLWAFPRPLRIHQELYKPFANNFNKAFQVSGLVPGLDTKAWKNASQYHMCSLNWVQVTPGVEVVDTGNGLDSLLGEVWATAAAEVRADLLEEPGQNIPLSKAFEIACERYPRLKTFMGDRVWRNEERVPLFWLSEAEASNDDLDAQVGLPGVYSFSTKTASFQNWRTLLGKEAVADYGKRFVAAAADGWWTEGTNYWRQADGNHWQRFDPYTASAHFHQPWDQAGEKAADADIREVVRLIHSPATRADAAIPLPYRGGPLVVHDNLRLLNTSNLEALEPAESAGKWGEHFPYAAWLLDTFFIHEKAKEHFLAWLKWFYAKARDHKPERGTALFLVGPREAGKTLITTHLIGGLAGTAGADAERFMCEPHTTFNEELIASPLWVVDDPNIGNEKTRYHFGAKLKKTVASAVMPYRGKYKPEASVAWIGQIVVSTNDDLTSLSALPTFDGNNIDKVSIHQARGRESGELGKKAREMGAEKPEHLLKKEVREFAAWLLEWTPPAWVQYGQTRFGVVEYAEVGIQRKAQAADGNMELGVLIRDFFTEHFDINGNDKIWEGNATMLTQIMRGEQWSGPLRGIASTSVALGRRMRSLCDSPELFENDKIEMRATGNTRKPYRIMIRTPANNGSLHATH